MVSPGSQVAIVPGLSLLQELLPPLTLLLLRVPGHVHGFCAVIQDKAFPQLLVCDSG